MQYDQIWPELCCLYLLCYEFLQPVGLYEEVPQDVDHPQDRDQHWAEEVRMGRNTAHCQPVQYSVAA